MEWDCAICGGSAATIRDCKYCTGVYCSDHALPEKHNCPGVAEIETSDEWFLTPETDVPVHDGEEVQARPEPLDRDEIRTYCGGIRVGRPSDGARDGSASDAGRDPNPSGAGGSGVISRLVSALQFWS